MHRDIKPENLLLNRAGAATVDQSALDFFRQLRLPNPTHTAAGLGFSASPAGPVRLGPNRFDSAARPDQGE